MVAMTIKPGDFQVQEGHKVELDKWPTEVQPAYPSTKIYQTLLDEQVDELSELQRLLYASNRHAVLLIFQAMDAAGKDGVIRHVMSGVNPQGCQGVQFQTPESRRTRARFSLAYLAMFAGARPHRHLQPIILRGGLDRAGPSRDSSGSGPAGWSARRENDLARALSFHH
jgi:polyphosphate kinase 2 (PPK2 family)